MLRTILHVVIRFLLSVLTRLQIDGLENVPESGGVILASNHVSILDAPLVFASVERRDLTALVADKYLNNPFISILVQAVGGIWINREAADLRALRLAREYLQAGHALGIAPEGTRSHTGGLIEGKTGVAYLAEKAGVPIVPVAIWGTEVAIHQVLRLKRAPVHIHFGKPFSLTASKRSDRGDRGAALQRNTVRIMCQIAALLPERYHGVYAGHACLQETLQADEPVALRE